MAYTYVKPQQTYGPGGITYGQYSDFFRQNPYQNQYANLLGRLQGYSGTLMNRNLQANPLGTIFSNPNQFKSQFGYSSNAVSPDNPNLSKWMANLRGGQQNLLNQAVNRMANAGIASSRGGMGVMGGMDPRSQMAQHATGQLAQQYSTDFSKAVEWERQNAELQNQTANAMAQMYANVYGTDMQTAANLLQQELQGTKYSADDLNAYLNAMYGAYAQDTAWTNQQIANRPNEQWQQRQRYQQQRQWDEERAKQYEINRLISTWPQQPQGRDWYGWTQSQNNLLQYLTTGAFPFATQQKQHVPVTSILTPAEQSSAAANQYWSGLIGEQTQALRNLYGIR
jgi:hypothetical protein